MKFAALPVYSLEDATLNFELLTSSGIFWGSGTPTFTPEGKAVSFYFRKDTPTVANQRLYVYTGSAWTGIL